MSIEAMKQALEALERLHDEQNGPPLIRRQAQWETAMAVAIQAITALRLAIEQSELNELEEGSRGPINDGWQLIVSDGPSNRGVYAYMPEYPEEAVFLMPIEQAERQEPVAWVCEGSSSDEKHAIDYQQEDVDAIPIGTMLYAAPPQQEKQEPVATLFGTLPVYDAPPQRQPQGDSE